MGEAEDILRHVPAASSEAVRKSMQGNKRRDTTPELKVRAMLRELGYPGYRLDWKKAPGHPDIAYPGRKIAVFVMGCFWHRCPVCNLPEPKSNVAYWQAKFERNVERDKRTRAALEELGWRVVVVWEHQLKKKELEATRRFLYDAVKRDEDAAYDERFGVEAGAETGAGDAEDAAGFGNDVGSAGDAVAADAGDAGAVTAASAAATFVAAPAGAASANPAALAHDAAATAHDAAVNPDTATAIAGDTPVSVAPTPTEREDS